MIKSAIGAPDAGQNLSRLLTYIGDELYEIYENIVTAAKPTLVQVNVTFEAHFAHTSIFPYECYLFRELKQRHDAKIHNFIYVSKNKVINMDIQTSVEIT